jgi:hypothetical protein
MALALILSVQLVAAANIEATDNTNVAVPADNGTSSQVNITAKMEQYVGFFGTVAVAVRRNTTNGYVMYNKTATSGKLYFYKAGSTVDGNVLAAPASSVSDGNFSLSGFYATANHFTSSLTVCGVASSNALTTTDGLNTSIYRNQTAGGANYFLCTDIANTVSTNGFGTVQYEIVVPKTSLYTAYDVYYDLE